MTLSRLVIVLASMLWSTDAGQIEYDMEDLLVNRVVIQPNDSCTVFYDTGRVKNVPKGGDVGNGERGGGKGGGSGSGESVSDVGGNGDSNSGCGDFHIPASPGSRPCVGVQLVAGGTQGS